MVKLALDCTYFEKVLPSVHKFWAHDYMKQVFIKLIIHYENNVDRVNFLPLFLHTETLCSQKFYVCVNLGDQDERVGRKTRPKFTSLKTRE